jgi:transposase
MGLDLESYTGILNIPNLKVEKVEYSEKELNIYCKIEKETAEICPSCQKKVIRKREKYRREVNDLGISGRKVTLHLLVHQYDCDCCHRTFSKKFDFVESNKSYTKRQAKWVFEMSAQQSYYRVAALIGFSNKKVERICYSQVIN